jgi:Putative peptidoglycan binding domain
MLAGKSRRAIIAVAGATASLASTVLTAAPAHAAVTDPEPQSQLFARRATDPGAAGSATAVTTSTEVAAALPTCTSWSDFLAPSGRGIAHLPTSARDNGVWQCGLGNGNANDAVTKLQDTLITGHCYGQDIAKDGIFGNQTEAALRNAQTKEGITADGKYGPESSFNLEWPVYSGNTFVGCELI